MKTSNVLCPACNATAKPLDKTGDAEGLDCPEHGSFKVVGHRVFVSEYKNPDRCGVEEGSRASQAADETKRMAAYP